MNVLISGGYPNVALYSMASWFNAGILNKWTYPLWVASYGSNTCGVNGNVQAWQFTDNWKGLSVDMSYDYGLFDQSPPTAQEKPHSRENTVVVAKQTYTREKYGMWLSEKLNPQSQWKSNGITAIGGQPAYQVANGSYLMQSATDQDGVATVHSYVNTKAPLVNKKGDYVRTVNNGESYKFSSFTQINGDWFYQVATNEYLPAIYTVGSGK